MKISNINKTNKKNNNFLYRLKQFFSTKLEDSSNLIKNLNRYKILVKEYKEEKKQYKLYIIIEIIRFVALVLIIVILR